MAVTHSPQENDMGASLRKKDGIWYARFYDRSRTPQRREVSLQTGYKDVAHNKLRELEKRWADPGDPYNPWLGDGDLRSSALSTEEAIEAFLASRIHLRPNTLRNYESYLKQWAGTLPVNLMLQDVAPDHIQPYVWGRLPKQKSATDGSRSRPIRQANALRARARHLAPFFGWAVRGGHIRANPMDAIELPQEERKLPTYLTPGHVEQLLTAIQKDFDKKHAEGKAVGQELLWLKEVVTFAVASGLRREEICALKWDAVNLSDRFVTVGKTERTKGRHQRPVPLAGPAFDVLTRRRDSLGSPSGFVFPGVRGGRMSGDYLGKAFKRAVRLAGLPEDVSFHSLRHTCASWLVMKGVPIRIVQEILGHSSASVTERYSHLAPGALRDAMENTFGSM